ncbi:hypothetical protein [Variovorax sp. PCZ-1]|uniref:hypothetical protein n=1 Tax=Variovorax sp. PCZ-1 TaxID=2835533 RepID=UPI001BCBAC59|nr:hypothetical protein [Variovorax sp. PCZ-1]MBS7808351.1 hypothetical protein [Variovorax sp. PCZ-1]
MSTSNNTSSHTLTIEYIDAQGQVQRTEQLSGEHFTLRVQSEALDVQASAHPADALANQSIPRLKAGQGLKPWPLALILFGIFAAIMAVHLWIEYTPGDGLANFVSVILGLVGGLALWAAFWALLGKIFVKHADFGKHVCLVLGAMILLTVIMDAMHFVSFSFSWRMLGKIDIISILAGMCLLAWAHLRLIVPKARHFNLRLGMIVFTLTAVSLLMWSNHRRQGTVLDSLHSPHLYRPALQFSGAISAQDFFKQASNMEATLKARSQKTEPGEDSIESEE